VLVAVPVAPACAQVYYSPNDRITALRHAKRYAIPTCPLLQVSCLAALPAPVLVRSLHLTSLAHSPYPSPARDSCWESCLPLAQAPWELEYLCCLLLCAFRCFPECLTLRLPSSPACPRLLCPRPPPPPPPPASMPSFNVQVSWWRVVVDEAQLVGPLSASGAMVEKMHAVHRWEADSGQRAEGLYWFCKSQGCGSCRGMRCGIEIVQPALSCSSNHPGAASGAIQLRIDAVGALPAAGTQGASRMMPLWRCFPRPLAPKQAQGCPQLMLHLCTLLVSAGGA
jgi:hypothetical protein